MAPVDYTPPVNPHTLHVPQTAEQSSGTTGRPWHGYTVRPGDTLAKLAIRHDTSIQALVAKNSIDDPRALQIGRRIQVPGPAPARSTPATPTTTGRPPAQPRTSTPARTTLNHTVGRGDTVAELARRYGVQWSTILKANRMVAGSDLRAGQTLRIPVPREQPSASNGDRSTPQKSGSQGATKAARSTVAGRTYPSDVVVRADSHREQLEHVSVPGRSQTRALIVSTARRYGVNPQLALAVGWQESGWNQRNVSPADAIGVMQLLPATAEWCGSMVGRRLDPLDTQDNVTGGVVLLRWLSQHASTPDEAIAGYYQGLAGVRQNGMYPDTRAYVRSVKAHMARF